ncbi:hypothetical protein [Angustibacter aerolatus]
MAPTTPPRRRGTRSRSLFAALAAALLLVGGASPALAGGHHGGRGAPRSAVPLPDGLRPEGITSVGTRYYVGSLADGRIVTGDLRRGGSTVLLPGATGRQVRGLAVDRRSGLLWAVGNVGAVAHVWAVRTRDGRVVADRVVPGGVFLNDLLVTRGAVWVTDSGVDRLTAVPLGRGGRPTTSALRYLPLRGAWPSVAEGNRANGIEWLSKGHVVLDHSTAGGLWDVSLRTGGARRIAVTGGPAIVGGDGLERAGRTLFVVRGTDDASVAQLRLQHRRGVWSARYQTRLTDPRLDVPSTATFARGGLYAVNARFGVASPETASYSITRLRVRR